MLAARGRSFPLLQSTLNYGLLAVYGFAWTRCARLSTRSWLRYALLALVDVQANCLLVLAYRYTSITSVMILDCFTIPCVMVLSKVILHAQYTRLHLLGVLACLAGLCCTVVSDGLRDRAAESDADQPPRAVLGDVLTLCGAALYAVSNVLMELLAKDRGRHELLGAIGAAGFLIGGAQSGLMERAAFERTRWRMADLGLVVAYSGCMFGFYAGAAYFLEAADAALFTLSLLTSDVYAVLYATLALQRSFHALYAVGFGLTLGGVVVFVRQPEPTRAPPAVDRSEPGDGSTPSAPPARVDCGAEDGNGTAPCARTAAQAICAVEEPKRPLSTLALLSHDYGALVAPALPWRKRGDGEVEGNDRASSRSSISADGDDNS